MTRFIELFASTKWMLSRRLVEFWLLLMLIVWKPNPLLIRNRQNCLFHPKTRRTWGYL